MTKIQEYISTRRIQETVGFTLPFRGPPCIICGKCEDNQEHALICNVLRSHIPREHKESLENVIYADLFGNTINQLRVTEVFSIIIKTRQRLRKDSGASLPGHHSGPQD